MSGAAMTAADEPDDRHASRPRRNDAAQAVLDHQTEFQPNAALLGGVEEQVRRWFAARDHCGGVDVRLQMEHQPGHRESVPDSVDMAVRGDAALHLERGEKLRDAVDRSEFIREGVDDSRTHPLGEPVGQGDAKLLPDGSGQGGRTLADPERHRLFERQHDPDFRKAFGEDAQLAMADRVVASRQYVVIEETYPRSLLNNWSYIR